ncbi:MAG: amidohydrolase, partial [Anaerolineae bacterium]
LAICNANIITMNPQQPRAEALTVRDGRIVAVGSWNDVALHAEGVTVLDLTGKTLMPGMIDTHAHFLWTALSLAALDVSGAKDHPSLQAIIRQAVADTPPGEPILGMGFTEYALDTARFSPIIHALDAVAPDNPVYLMGVTGHTSAANTRALKLLAFPTDTPGVMRDADGHPNGLLADRANNLAFAKFGESFGVDEKAAEMVGRAIETAHSMGITTLHALEGGIAGEDKAAEEFLATVPTLPLRFVFYYQTMDVDRVVKLGLPRIGGCILLDGDVGPHTAAFTEPYADNPECYGTLYYTQKEVDTFVLKAHEAGLQVAMHAIGDAAIKQALDAYEAALDAHPRDDHRHRIEHADLIREDQIQRAQRLGLALAIQPPFNYYWPHTKYCATLGEERAWRADPFRAMINAGLLLAGGSDSTVTPLGPLIGVHAAVNHTNPAERLSVQEGLELYTINAARIAFQEADRGSLKVGKLGDFVALAEDPFEVDPGHIVDIPVEMTVIGGDVVYRRDEGA